MPAEASGRDAADASIDAAAAALATDSAELMCHVLDAAPVGIAFLDTDLHWRYANPAFRDAAGLPPTRPARQDGHAGRDERGGPPEQPGAPSAAGLVGRHAADTPSTVSAPGLPGILHQVLSDGRPRDTDVGGPAVAGRQLCCRRLDVGGRTLGLITVLQQRPVPEEHQRQQQELARARARLAVLDAAADRIGTTLDTDTTCAELADFAVPSIADLAVVEVLPPEDAERSPAGTGRIRLHRAATACTPTVRPHLATLALPGGPVRHAEGSAVARSLRTGRAVHLDITGPGPVVPGTEADPPAADPVTLAAYRTAGIGTVLSVPLTARGRTVGVLTLARTRARGPRAGFDADDLVTIADLAGRASIGIDNARRHTRTQGITLELQRALLAEPGSPHPNLALASRYLPSGTSSVVGGDWYETVRLPFGRTLLVMGDVMGHGVEAAVDMSTYRAVLRDVAGMDLPPHRILRQLDALISENDSARPATCVLALADPGRSRWTFSSAGHLPPALVSADRPTELIALPTGPPLGTGLGGYEQVTRPLLADHVLLLYTDGLVERRGEDIDDSLARLAALHLPVTGTLDELLDAALRKLAPDTAEDDIALLAARLRRR
ncbi:SpoIIE family protein phosphatase [Kitasatospora sp. NBC_01539]|uniref:SpoIIE family protein phosphatase n=1 Tax=Kitasatospora sp. NBC_01539 TaxID=2903577 RepID=UPI00386008F2